MSITSFEGLAQKSRESGGHAIAVAGADDPDVLHALESALNNGLVTSAYLVGDPERIRAELSAEALERVEIVGAETPLEVAQLAVARVRNGGAEILMKGRVDSTNYLKAVVNRDNGLRQSGALSNVTVAEMPGMGRLIAATDNGIMPEPTLEQKRDIILNTVPLFRGLGLASAKVAAICATEKASDAMPATRDAEALAKESAEKGFDGFEVGGPMGYDVAISPEAAKKKGLDNLPAAGSADLLLFSNIDAANAVAKSWKFHGHARTGSIVLGATAPVLLNSRSDSSERRLDALLLASAVIAGNAMTLERKDKRRNRP